MGIKQNEQNQLYERLSIDSLFLHPSHIVPLIIHTPHKKTLTQTLATLTHSTPLKH